MKPILLKLFVFGLGIVVGVLGLQLRSAAGYWRHLPEPSSSAMALPTMEPSIDPANIHSGDPLVSAVVFSQTAGGSSVAGVWECIGPAEFDVTFRADERLYVLEGSVDVDYLGNRFTLETGDTAFFRAGTTAIWSVESALKKVWVQHDPGRRIRSMDRLSRSRP